MSQPPQNGWGQPPSEDPYGQSSANGGYDAAGQSQPGYDQSFGNQSSPNGYGQSFGNQGAPEGGYGQAGGYDQAGGYGQASPGGQDGQGGSFAPSFGDTGNQAFGPQGAAPKKSNKLPIILCAGCALLALLLIVVGGGIFLFARGGGETTGGGGGEPTTTEEPAAAPAGDGSEENPYATGQMFTMDDGEGGTLDLTVGAVNWDGTEAVMDANEFNTEPGDDQTYILIPVTMTYHGDGTVEPFLAVIIDYVSDAGTTYSDEGTITPKSAFSMESLSDGDTAEYEVGIIVPKDEIESGVLTADVLFNFDSEPVWVTAG